MLKSLKLIHKYFRRYKKEQKIISRILAQIFSFLLLIFIFGYIFYHITYLYQNTAMYKYAIFDVKVYNISPYQVEKLRSYDFVEKVLTFNVVGLEVTNGDRKKTMDFLVLNTDSLKDVDYTPFNTKLILKRDEELLNRNEINPIVLTEYYAKSINVNVGDKVIVGLPDEKIECTIAGIYDDIVKKARLPGFAFILSEPFNKWFTKIKYFNYQNAFIKFSDKEKGINFFKNDFICDSDLYMKYGEAWPEKATEDELKNARMGNTYNLTEADYYIKLNNTGYGFIRIICIILFSYMVLITFIIWYQSKVICFWQV